MKKSEQTRMRIYHEAFSLFEKNGFKNTTIPTICEKAGVSRSTFFHYFKSKSDLLSSYRYNFAENVAAFASTLPDSYSGKEKVLALLLFDVEQNIERGAKLRQAIISSLEADPEFDESDNRTFTNLPPLYSQILQTSNPEATEEYCDEVALLIVRVYWVIWRCCILLRFPLDFKQEVSDSLELLWGGVNLQ